MVTLSRASGAPAAIPSRRVRRLAGGALVAGYLLAVYGAVALTGGAPNPLVHFAYVAVVGAAMAFGAAGGIGAGIAAGILLGPAMPDSTAASLSILGQWGWLVRLLAYVAAGLVVGAFWERSQRLALVVARRRVHRRATAAIEASEERLRRTIEVAADGIIVLDVRGQITLANATVERFLGVDRATFLGLPLGTALGVVAPELRWATPTAGRDLAVAIGTGRPGGPYELTLRLADGRSVTIELRAVPLADPDAPGGTVLSLRDLTIEKARVARREARRTEAREAAETALDTSSAAGAAERLVAAFGRLWPIMAGAVYLAETGGATGYATCCATSAPLPPALPFGPELAGPGAVRLPLAAAPLPAAARDALAAAGARSWLVLALRGTDEGSGVFVAAEAVAPRPLTADEEEILAAFAESASAVVRGARLAEEAALRAVRTRVEAVLARPTLLRPVFQPMLALASGQVAGYEALARFALDPLAPPDAWFADAARVGLGAELQGLAISRALEVSAQAGGLPPGVFLSLNVSPRLLGAAATTAALAATSDLRDIVIELTEEEAVTDYGSLRAAMAPYLARGARFAVDDAGAGYASLRHITELRPAFVKLDAALIGGLGDDEARQALAIALGGFVEEIGATLVAEGVESPRDLDVLTRTHLPILAQGYGVARPGRAWPAIEPEARAIWRRARRRRSIRPAGVSERATS